MRLKDIPKEVKGTDGVVYGVLVVGGYQPIEINDKTINVKRIYYRGVGDMEGRDFTTGGSDTLWCAFVVEAWLRQGGKLTDVKPYVGIYKRYKANRRDNREKMSERRFKRTGRYFKWNAHLRPGFWPVDSPSRPIYVTDADFDVYVAKEKARIAEQKAQAQVTTEAPVSIDSTNQDTSLT